MKHSRPTLLMTSAGLLLASAASLAAEDWPMWGRTMTRNMSTPSSGSLPIDFFPGEFIGASDQIDESTAKGVRWIAKLGSQSYGNVTVADGRVFVGTNNESPRDPKYPGDRSVIYCFDEATGEFLWQLNFPKLGTGKVSDWEFLGICSSPTIEGDRMYFVSNLCQVVCADVNGMADGSDGPFTDESAMLAEPGGEPIPMGEKDGDIIWTMNMTDECGVFPHNITSSSVLVAGDKLWVTTSNGVDYGHVATPAPFAPCLIQVDKNTGELRGEEQSGLSERIFHCNWTSPAYLKTDEAELCIFGGPDGWIYGFRPEPEQDDEGFMVLQEAFRFDANPPEYRMRDGKPVRYATVAGPSEVIGTPVVYEGLVYAAIGQDPEHGEGAGNIVCMDPTKTGDTTDTAEVWSYDRINRSVSTPSIVDGLVYVSDFSGFIYCFDARTGELYWRHDTLSHIWGSTLVADGKVYVGNEDGYLTILKAGKELEVLGEIAMGSPIYSSPVAANGTLYVQSHTHLFAIEGDDEVADEPAPGEPIEAGAMALYRRAQEQMNQGEHEAGFETAKLAMNAFIAEDNDLAWMLLESIPLDGKRVDVHFNMGPAERDAQKDGIVRPLSFRVWAEEGSRLISTFDFETAWLDGTPVSAAFGKTDRAGHVNYGTLPFDSSYLQIRARALEIADRGN